MGLIVVIICIVLWISHKRGEGGFKIPSWLFKGIGIFLIFVLLQNIKDVYVFLTTESSSWWPLVQENAAKFSASLREFIRTLTGG